MLSSNNGTTIIFLQNCFSAKTIFLATFNQIGWAYLMLLNGLNEIILVWKNWQTAAYLKLELHAAGTFDGWWKKSSWSSLSFVRFDSPEKKMDYCTHCILHLKFGKVKILCPNKNLKPAATVHVWPFGI